MSESARRIPRFGRPAIPPEHARRNRVVAMVTDGELQQLQELAVAHEQSVSALVHEILLNDLNRRAKEE